VRAASPRAPSALTVGAGLAIAALAAAGCASTPPGSSRAHAPATTGATANPTAVADNEAALSALYGGCGGTCRYEVVSTTDGAGGTLYGIEVVQQFGEGYGRGAVFFFHGTSLLAGTGALAPATSVEHGSGLDWVLDPGAGPGISVPSPGRFAVTYVVSSAPGLCNACDGNDGTDTFVYRWDRSALVLQSGTEPTPPAVIGDGSG
jgi:hypothetical protein